MKEILEEMENIERRANQRHIDDPDVADMRESPHSPKSPIGKKSQKIICFGSPC